MDVVELEEMKDRVAEHYQQSPGGDLDGMLEDVRSALERSGMFTRLVVRKTGSRHHLIEARCKRSSPNLTTDLIRSKLERIWEEELRYDDFASHAADITETALVFDFLTASKSARLYMTGMIIVDLN